MGPQKCRGRGWEHRWGVGVGVQCIASECGALCWGWTEFEGVCLQFCRDLGPFWGIWGFLPWVQGDLGAGAQLWCWGEDPKVGDLSLRASAPSLGGDLGASALGLRGVGLPEGLAPHLGNKFAGVLIWRGGY